MIIGLHKSKGFISSAIRFQTRGPYSHASVIFGDYLYEAREFKGVIKTHRDDYRTKDHIDFFRVPLAPLQEEKAHLFAEKQLGKPYDYTMVMRFVSRRQESRKSQGKWFCSEYVFAISQAAGKPLFANTDPYEVSPRLLHRSTRIIPVGFDWLKK